MPSAISKATTTPKIFMPTHAQLVRTYTSIVENKMKHPPKPAHKAPVAKPENYMHFNVTPKGLLGVHKEVYMIKGNLYLKVNAVVPNSKAQWFNCGPAPLF